MTPAQLQAATREARRLIGTVYLPTEDGAHCAAERVAYPDGRFVEGGAAVFIAVRDAIRADLAKRDEAASEIARFRRATADQRRIPSCAATSRAMCRELAAAAPQLGRRA